MNLVGSLKKGLLGDILALLAGAALTLAFAPFSLFFIAILSPAVLLGLWLPISPKKAFWRGWFYGLGFFGTSIYWVFISINTYGNAPILFAAFITGAFIAVLALFPAICGYLLNRFFPRLLVTKLVLAFPALWVLLEWVRSWIFSGFPWVLIGNSQINSPLKGYAPLFSVYGISLAILFTAGLLIACVVKLNQKHFKLFTACFLLIILTWTLGGLSSLKMWTHPEGNPIQASLVQGNIPQEIKWSPTAVGSTLDQYATLSSAHWKSQLVIWPEMAIPLSLQDAGDYLETIFSKAKQHGTTFITGIPIETKKKNGYYNAVIAYGDKNAFYAKQRLVPFGEFIPLAAISNKIFGWLDIPMSNLIPGDSIAKPFLVHGIQMATFICYEIAYPEQVLTRNKDLGAILTVSNDGWFGHSIAQAQHLEIAQMRALELQRPVLFVSNNGITAFIDAKGKIQSAAPPFEAYVLTDKFQATIGKTPWQRFALDPLLLTLVIMLIVAVIKQKKNKLGNNNNTSL